MAEQHWETEVLHFWFDELGKAHWFAKSEPTDAQIREALPCAARAARGRRGDQLAPCASQLLAAIIVLDQFSRNLFRDTPRAYAADPIARRLARSAIAQGFDVAMTAQERCFLYLPFEHSEDRARPGALCRVVRASSATRSGRAMPWSTRRSSIASAAFRIGTQY